MTMKKMKKLLSMLLTVIMVLAMAAPSFADEPKDGSITIKNATIGKEYIAYRIFAATRGVAETENATTPISYVATEEQKSWFEAQQENVFKFTSRNDTNYPFYVTVDENKTGQEIATFLTSLITKTDTVEGEEVTSIDTSKEFFSKIIDYKSATAESANCVIEGLGYGYFLVTSGLGTTISLDSTNPTATILDKNQKGPSKDEDDGDGKYAVTLDANGNVVENSKLSDTSASYGEKVNFMVQFGTTNYEGENPITEYIITDTLQTGMTYNLDNVKVFVGNTQLNADSYTVSPIISVEGGSSFTITVPWNTDYASPNKLIATYSAIVDENADITNAGIKNTAKLSYKVNGETKTPDNLQDEVITYLYALAIQKTDQNGSPLAGATFTLTDDNQQEIKVNGQNGMYSYSANGTATIESPADGKIIIKGLKAGTYRLKETKAPNGYNLLTEEKNIVATKAEQYKTTYYYTYENGTVTSVTVEEGATAPAGAVEVSSNGMPLVTPVTVINNAGGLLPSTGGIGTTIFYAAGIVLMAGAVFFVVRRKRA